MKYLILLNLILAAVAVEHFFSIKTLLGKLQRMKIRR